MKRSFGLPFRLAWPYREEASPVEWLFASAASRCWFCMCCVNQSFCLGELVDDERELAPTLDWNESSKGFRWLLGGAGFGEGERMFSPKRVRMMTGRESVRCLVCEL